VGLQDEDGLDRDQAATNGLDKTGTPNSLIDETPSKRSHLDCHQAVAA